MDQLNSNRLPALDCYDVAVIGAGISGMATAARLQAAGLQTLVLESHGLVGGCAGYFRRRGFCFDVGATTLVDFEADGVGGELLSTIGMSPPPTDVLPGYLAWLPDRVVTLHRDQAKWAEERLRSLGDSPAHRRLWRLFDRIAAVFWQASRRGIKLPMANLSDVFRNAAAVGFKNLPLARYLTSTVGDVLRSQGLRDDRALTGVLSMLIEDTVHATIDDAPLINGVLGTTIRSAGLSRARGGMYGFWRAFVPHYLALGGHLRVGTTVRGFHGREGDFTITTSKGTHRARKIVSALPAQLTARVGPQEVRDALEPFLKRDNAHLGGALVVFLGVPESEVSTQAFTHHQLLQSYDAPLGNGNNMFISVSAEGDTTCAPEGHRAVMISTHCDLEPWQGLSHAEYTAKKQGICEQLVKFAQRVYPELGTAPRVFEMATPKTYERFTKRPEGAVGGVRLNLKNSNQHAIPHDIGVPGVWLGGDTTWPGLGTVACVLGSRVIADGVLGSVNVVPATASYNVLSPA